MKSETRAGRWMVVDDDDQVLEIFRTMLKHFQREIDCFKSPQKALIAFANQPDAYELVVTDFDMPEMNGMELSRQMRQKSSDLKVLMATGSGLVTQDMAADAGLAALLSKPFALNMLCEALVKVGVASNIELPAR